MKRTLSLRREVLDELTTGELSEVVAGQITLVTIPASQCLSRVISCFYC